MNVSTLDIVFAAMILLSAVRCAFRGFVTEVLAVAAVIFGIGGAIAFSGMGGRLLETYLGSSVWNQVIAFLAIFIVVYLILKLLEGFLSRLLERLHLDRLDRSLGLFLGIAEGVIAVIVVIFVMKIQPFFDIDALLSDSFIAVTIMKVLPFSEESLREGLQVPDV